jgi:hypothetical protein
MEMIIENWALIVAVLALSAACVLAVARFVQLPSAAQLEKVQNWLLLAVSEAERELGGGTGELKLRLVYDKFLGKFPWLAKVIPFKRFVAMVRKALEEMEAVLADNPKVREYVEGPEDMEEEEDALSV